MTATRTLTSETPMEIAALPLSGIQTEFELEIGPHGAGELAVVSFHAREELSRPFSVEVTFAALPGLSTTTLEGEKAFLRVLHCEAARFFHGIVEEAACIGPSADPERWLYRLRYGPRLFRLTNQIRSRVFQQMTVPQIVREVLKNGGIEPRTALSRSYANREYCVQYRESDFDFISRLLEEEGIAYWFEQKEEEHTLVLGDARSAHEKLPGDSEIAFREESGMVPEREAFTAFSERRRARPNAVVLRDRNYMIPGVDLTARAGGAGLEVYDHCARYATPAEGKVLAEIRFQEEQARAMRWTGRSTSRRLCPGYVFELAEHPHEEANGEYLIVSVNHRGVSPEWLASRSRGPTQRRPSYENQAVCLKKEIPFRPERKTPRPSIAGWQTATVVGPASEEIHTDAQGRVKVQFHWDREGILDDQSSCFIRVTQALAGPGFGALALPRIGQEVVVVFQDGDPDRPLVIGAAYNGANRPPLDLPAEKTRSTFKTRSSPASDTLGYNELRFEDAANMEEVFLHAQKDLSIEVGNDKTQSVGGNEILKVKYDRSRTVRGNQSLEVAKNDSSIVGGNQSLRVKQNRITEVNGNHTETVGEDQSITVGGDETVTVSLGSAETIGLGKVLGVGGAYLVHVGGAMNEVVMQGKTEEVSGAKVEKVGAAKTETVKGSRTLLVGGDLTETVEQKRTLIVKKDLVADVRGNLSQTVAGGYALEAKRIEIVADDECTLRVGSACFQMKRSGEVSINGKKIVVNGIESVKLRSPSISEN